MVETLGKYLEQLCEKSTKILSKTCYTYKKGLFEDNV